MNRVKHVAALIVLNAYHVVQAIIGTMEDVRETVLHIITPILVNENASNVHQDVQNVIKQLAYRVLTIGKPTLKADVYLMEVNAVIQVESNFKQINFTFSIVIIVSKIQTYLFVPI